MYFSQMFMVTVITRYLLCICVLKRFDSFWNFSGVAQMDCMYKCEGRTILPEEAQSDKIFLEVFPEIQSIHAPKALF